MFIVYIIYSEKFDSFYIGYTSDMERRIIVHNSGKTHSTKNKMPWKVVYQEEFNIKLEAVRREIFLKRQRNKLFYKKLCNL